MSIPLKNRINSFVSLGERLKTIISQKESGNHTVAREQLSNSIKNAAFENPWFTRTNCIYAINNIANMLDKSNLEGWLSKYDIPETSNKIKTIAVIMAGNIPAVGFHDLLCVLISGNRILCKLSSNDSLIIKAIIKNLIEIDNRWENLIRVEETIIKNFDCVIATGSNNSARYFDYYFGKYPSIIRKNRSSIAILNGNESDLELTRLGKDIFMYFGLGCRNVNQILIPKNFNIQKLFPLWEDWAELINHFKYANNYDYNKTIFLVNKIDHMDLGYALVKKDNSIISPISVVNYSYYKNLMDLNEAINANCNNIQCISSSESLENSAIPVVPFGKTQSPQLWDYADGIDTLAWALKL